MISLLGERFETSMMAISSEDSDFIDACRSTDIIMNATNMGMKGFPSPHIEWIPWNSLKSDTWICDVVNKPIETEFVKTARSYGYRAFTGDAMTLYQAKIAYQLFLETEKVPFEGMKDALRLYEGVKR